MALNDSVVVHCGEHVWLDIVMFPNMVGVGVCLVLECGFNNDMQRAEYIVDCDETFGSGY
ncbi:MAG: hypothetical protein DRN71_00910 [Candidatus Nanohalarchaeota archaeon]|nr:MAG: hypothetical protein DRN71_00910 [Candidatus Nanohaloarchaeota archaeon]